MFRYALILLLGLTVGATISREFVLYTSIIAISITAVVGGYSFLTRHRRIQEISDALKNLQSCAIGILDSQGNVLDWN
jgi:hypothetical protein